VKLRFLNESNDSCPPTPGFEIASMALKVAVSHVRLCRLDIAVLGLNVVLQEACDAGNQRADLSELCMSACKTTSVFEFIALYTY